MQVSCNMSIQMLNDGSMILRSFDSDDMRDEMVRITEEVLPIDATSVRTGRTVVIGNFTVACHTLETAEEIADRFSRPQLICGEALISHSYGMHGCSIGGDGFTFPITENGLLVSKPGLVDSVEVDGGFDPIVPEGHTFQVTVNFQTVFEKVGASIEEVS